MILKGVIWWTWRDSDFLVHLFVYSLLILKGV